MASQDWRLKGLRWWLLSPVHDCSGGGDSWKVAMER